MLRVQSKGKGEMTMVFVQYWFTIDHSSNRATLFEGQELANSLELARSLHICPLEAALGGVDGALWMQLMFK